MKPLTLACVGAGNWGRNLVRVFQEMVNVRVKLICDSEEAIRNSLRQQYPNSEIVSDCRQVLEDREVEAIVIALPAVQHYSETKKAIVSGKHVFVEKPMTMDFREAAELDRLAEKQGKILMVGHLLKYHPAVTFLKSLIQSGEFGEVYYLYSQRVNLGIIRQDENALWSFAPHDVSVVLHLLEQEPDSVSARGECYLQPHIEDVVFVNLHFADRKMAQLQLSWLDPHKVRKLTVVGSRKMAVFDDVESAEKIRVYDKSVESRGYVSYGEAITIRYGDVVIPHIEMVEPLSVECRHFVECVTQNKKPDSDSKDGMRVVRVLEAAQRSMSNNGAAVPVVP